ncbi:hypothetical protein M4J06_001506 [Streptomyces coelicoflavus]|uniref:hypothetical protein n=1 Tax=Streptomyces TaxID=1883 RepID=UPI00210D4C3C|nr:hypothetical protein [Streptomyces coelicoflavus]MCQ4203890.1 hypothetical protein [Streptomyces coelicoflavus]
MTAAIMTRPVARATGAEATPEWCEPVPTGSSAGTAHRQLGDLLARMVHEADSRVPAGRRARRTLQEMQPGYERQPVLVLHRPVMADDACPLCGSWNCDPTKCPPSGLAPALAPAEPRNEMQCDRCGGVFGAAPMPTGTQRSRLAPTAWTCDACKALGI